MERQAVPDESCGTADHCKSLPATSTDDFNFGEKKICWFDTSARTISDYTQSEKSQIAFSAPELDTFNRHNLSEW